MPYWRVLGLRIARLQRTHDHLAAVYPDANFDWHSAGLKKAVAIAANLLLHSERRVNRALRMILVRHGRTEQCEDAVSGILHVAIVTACRIDHYFQSRVHDRACLLGIEVLLELGRALDVSEQRSDSLALAVYVFVRCRFSYPNRFSFLNRG
jgi:hypothetical protein